MDIPTRKQSLFISKTSKEGNYNGESYLKAFEKSFCNIYCIVQPVNEDYRLFHCNLPKLKGVRDHI